MVSDKEKWATIKEIIDAMQAMDEANRQFLLGYVAGVCARVEEAAAGA